METIQAQVLAVSGKNTSRGVVYEVQMGNGTTYSTWDGNLAAKANTLQGQLADARVNTTTNNKNGRTYTNHNLEDIAPAGQLAATAVPVDAGTPVGVPIQGGNGAAANIPMQAQDVRVPDVERQRMITKQSSLKTAFDFVGNLYAGAGPEALEAATEQAFGLASKLYAKVYSNPATPATPVALPPDATPTAVAEAVNAASETGAEVAVGATAAPEPEW